MAGKETTETNEETFGFSTSQRSTRSKQKQLMSTDGHKNGRRQTVEHEKVIVLYT